MKIIIKTLMPIVTCNVCKTVFKPNKRDLIDSVHSHRFDHARCPVCKTINRVFNKTEET
jgi:rubredoxin